MSSSNEIAKVNLQIRSMQFPRIIAFADVVSRYTQKILKNKVSWLRASALMFLITRGGSLTPGATSPDYASFELQYYQTH